MRMAVVKKTGEQISVQDYGEKFFPRYWTDKQGYSTEELKFNKR
jgi:hypothetical protein